VNKTTASVANTFAVALFLHIYWHPPQLCHLDRSAAQWRDPCLLRFANPLSAHKLSAHKLR
jgi:hypothetical protein